MTKHTFISSIKKGYYPIPTLDADILNIIKKLKFNEF